MARYQLVVGDIAVLRAPAARVVAWLGESTTLVSSVLIGAAAVIWWTSLGTIDESLISDIGFITALPPGTLLAPVLLSAAFVIALNGHRLYQPVLVAALVLLVVVLHGTPSAIQEVPRFSTTYVHAGFGEAIMRTGELFVNRDARFSWPLFFILTAYVTSIAGLENPLALTAWIPTISNLLYLIPLFMIFRVLTADRRLVWLGLWIFVMANWVGQDYFSPQGFNILLLLTTLAILLTWFRTGERALLWGLAARVRRLIRSPAPTGPSPEEVIPRPAVSSKARAGLVLVLVLLAAVIVASHQLTPFALFISTGLIVITRQTTLRGFPILVGLLLGTWLSYMTLAYLAGHINSLLAEALQAEAVATAAISDRLRGNPGHVFVVTERIVFSGVFWGIAFLGGIRRFWNGQWDLAPALLAGFPFGFLALQSYGGEMLLRVYLIALPFMCFFVAGLFYPRIRAVSRLQPVLILLLSTALILGFQVARFGNDRADRMTADEVAAADRAIALAPAGSVIATGNHNSPLGYDKYDKFVRVGLVGGFVSFTADQIAEAFRKIAAGRPAFLYLSESQRSFFDLNGFPGEEWDLLVEEMKVSTNFRIVFETGDTYLFELVDTTADAVP
jgi:hypothetical protein